MPVTLRKIVLSALAVAMLSLTPLAASADEYDEGLSGHPLRIAGYILHPIGVVIDALILRPAHWVGSQEPFSTIFGHETDD